MMEWPALVTGLILLEYFVFVGLVGAARVKGNVQAPDVSGDEVFERTFRVQQNTLEQLIYVLPSLWIFAYFVSANWAAILGAVFLVGRLLYCIAYRADPRKRAVGFLTGWVASIVLLLGALYGAASAVL